MININTIVFIISIVIIISISITTNISVVLIIIIIIIVIIIIYRLLFIFEQINITLRGPSLLQNSSVKDIKHTSFKRTICSASLAIGIPCQICENTSAKL